MNMCDSFIWSIHNKSLFDFKTSSDVKTDVKIIFVLQILLFYLVPWQPIINTNYLQVITIPIYMLLFGQQNYLNNRFWTITKTV